jgi:hypothetical protein
MNAVLLALLLAVFGAAAQADERLDRLNRSTAKVLATKRSGEVPGAAIMMGELGDKTFFLTACHVVADARSIALKLFARVDPIPVSIFDNRCDDELDLSVLVAPSHLVTGAVDQIQQGDPAALRAGDRVLVHGHPPDREWSLRDTTVTSISGTHVVVGPKVIGGGDSGGALLNTYGHLVGIVVEETAQGDLGRAVRIDTALARLDTWRVPYKTRLHVNFCDMITSIISWSEQDFDAIKGSQLKRDYATNPEWALRNRTMDITGEGGARLARDPRYGPSGKTQYIASFGRQRNEEEARKVWKEIAQRVKACLPTSERILTEGTNCLNSSWLQRFTHTPIQFFTYVKPFYSEVELIMYRDYKKPYVCGE